MVDRLASNGLMDAIIGNYRVERLLGRDAWGPVLQVVSRDGRRCLLRLCGNTAAYAPDTPHALSTMDVVGTGQDSQATARLLFLARFQQEAKQISLLRHAHIVPLLDYGNFHGLPYLVYPQLPLTPLSEVLAQQGPLSLPIVGQYLHQITSALDYAHEHEVLHRNLSLACISLWTQGQAHTTSGLDSTAAGTTQSPSQRLLIAEFGLRYLLELSRSGLQEASAGMRRRPAYDGSIETSAPEQLLGQPIDTYTDVYACGVLLYRLLTGHAPFEGATRDEVARQHLYGRVPAPHKWREDVPVALYEVLQKALAKDPHERYGRPAELARAYQEALQPRMLPQPTPTEIVSSRLSFEHARPAQAGQRPLARRRILALAAGCGVAVVGTLAGMRLLQGRAPSIASLTPGTRQVTLAHEMLQTPPDIQDTQNTHRPAVQAASSTQKLLARVADVPANGAIMFARASQQRPGILIHLPEQHFVAFDSTCTHAGCGVAYNGQTRLLECPCHGASFDPAQKGAVVSGPAQSPLASIAVQVHADGTITTV